MLKKIKNICCIGAGYVGGPTMAVFAKNCPELKVNVVDINQSRIDSWNSEDLTKLPVFEPGLDDVIKACRNKNLFFSTDIQKNISEADMIFISVNTPTKTKGFGAGKALDLKWVESSARVISQYSKGYTIVVEKSTLPVKTAETIKAILQQSNNNEKNKTFSVLSNPEFLAEGTAISDLENPDRILIGGDEETSINALASLYRNWIPEKKIIKTNLWSSELSKLTANAFLAQRISSINSISALCEKTDADIVQVINAIGADKRIGKYFLNPGPAFGGSCFQKDILNLIYLSSYYGLEEVANYWEGVIRINNWQKNRISNLIIEKLFGTISDKKIAIYGFAFKKNTNDTRESASINICRNLIEEGARLCIYDPKVTKEQMASDLIQDEDFEFTPNSELGSWSSFSDPEKAIIGADAIVVITEWEEFKFIDWNKINKLMRKPAWIFDTRAIINIEEANKAGFNVWSIGNANNV